MELLDLVLFEKVCAQGSISRAATEMGMAQAAVSVRMRGLEVELGQPLFERSRRGVQLTAAGESFLPYVQRCLAILHEGRQAVRSTEPVQFRLATVTGLAPFVAPAIARYWEQKAAAVRVTTGSSSEAVARLMDNCLDLAVVLSMPLPPGLRSVQVDQTRLALVAPAEHRLVQTYAGQPVPLGDLLSARLVLSRKSAGGRELIDRLEALNGAPVANLVEAPWEVCRQLLLTAGAISLLPAAMVAEDVAAGRVVAMTLADFEPPAIEILAVYRDRKRPHPGVEPFLRLLRESLSS